MTAASKLTWESMTYLTVGRFTVRVWRDEAEDIESDRRFSNGDLEDRALELTDDNCDNPVIIAREFCKLQRVAAVEVLDVNRNGCVVYRNWPA